MEDFTFFLSGITMLSYQHLYHAGCAADVHKHAALAALLSHMTRKDKALTYMETHAARGLYNLSDAASLKTGEADSGINRLSAADLERLNPDFKEALQHVRHTYTPQHYPGSPFIARHFLRDHDSIHLCELHPQEFAALKTVMTSKNIFLHHKDGYETVLSLSPPTPRRGVVLIDPSYEIKDEYNQIPAFFSKLLSLWPEASVMLWYPILSENRHKPMMDTLKSQCGNLRQWHDEVIFENNKGMEGSGLFAVNMPYGLTFPDFKAVLEITEPS